MKKLIVELQINVKDAIQQAKKQLETLNTARINLAEKIKSSLVGVKEQFISFFSGIQGVITAIVGGAVVKTITGIVDKYDAVVKKLSALEGNKANEILDALRKTASETNMELSILADTFATLRSILPTEQALALTQQIYRLADAYGLSEQEAERFGNAIARSFAFGDVGARELYSILANAPQFLNAFANQLGISTQEFIQNLQAGKYTIQELYNLLANAPLPKSIGTTTEGLAGLRTQIESIIYSIIQATGGLERVKSIIQAIKDFIDKFTPEIKLIASIVYSIGEAFKNFWLYAIQDILKLTTQLWNFVLSLGQRFSLVGSVIEAIKNAFKSLISLIATGIVKLLELIAKIPIIGASSRAVLDSIKQIQKAIAEYKDFKLKANIEPQLPKEIPTVKLKGNAEVEQVIFKEPTRPKEAIRGEIPQYIETKTIPVEIKPVPKLYQLEDIETIFLYELQNRIQSTGEGIGKSLAEAIKKGTYTNLSQDLSDVLIDAIFSTLAILQPQLAPFVGILSGLLKGLLEPSPEIENAIQKTTNIQQEINIYIERPDLSDKGFWEALVREKIQPAVSRLNPEKRSWGL